MRDRRKVIRKGQIVKLSIVLFVALFACILMSSAMAQGSGVRGEGSVAELEVGSYVGQDEGTVPAYVAGNAEFFSTSANFISEAALGNVTLVFIIILMFTVFVATFVYSKFKKRSNKMKRWLRFYLVIALIFAVFAGLPGGVSAEDTGNQAPTILFNEGLDVSKGGFAPIYNTDLQVTDVDNSDNELTFLIEIAPIDGYLALGGTQLYNNDTFTQDDINMGIVGYYHDDSETSSDSFTFSVSDGAGGSIPSTIFHITITAPPSNYFPIAKAGPDQTVEIDEIVYFDGSSSYDTDGVITSYEWDFGDGSEHESGVTASHVYNDSGNYAVTLTVTDDDGASDEDTLIVSIPSEPQPPENIPAIAVISAPGQAYIGDIVVFDGSYSWDNDGYIVSYRWDLTGEGYLWEGMIVEHVFTELGLHTVYLSVIDDDGEGWGEFHEILILSPYFAGGLGQIDYPFEISNVSELQNMKLYLDAHYVLLNDIDASDTSTWNSDGKGGYLGFEPVGTSIAKFTGTFDGNGYKIMDLYINRISTDNIGLFGYCGVNSRIENVGLNNVNITGGSFTGALIGFCQGIVSDCYSTGLVRGGPNLGGLIGGLELGSIIYSYTNCNITGGTQIGGVIGKIILGSILNCYSESDLTGFTNVGGLVGLNENVNNSIINCYSTGNVDGSGNGSGMYTGGLVGYNQGTILHSYASANITGQFYAGGLVGYNLGGDISNCYSTGNVYRYDFIGGLIGCNEGGNISNCYSTGDVTGFGSCIGGLIGFGNPDLVTGSFWDIETSGLNTSNGGIGKSTTEMMLKSTYTNWNFLNIWEIIETVNYPYLKWINNPPIADAGGPYEGFVDDSIIFDASSSYDPDGDDLWFQWDFDNDGIWDKYGSSSFHKWNEEYDGLVVVEVHGNGFSVLDWTTVNIQIHVNFPGGDGSILYPYKISNIEELRYMKYDLDAHYILINDIDASDTTNWNNGKGFEPIGNSLNKFTGTLNGNGYKISNLYINQSSDYSGLFGYCGVSSEVENVCLENVNIDGGSFTGALVGYCQGTVSNCDSSGIVHGNSNVGGLIGGLLSESIIDCSANCTVGGSSQVGGFIGNIIQGSISNCHSEGTIIGITIVGGLVGENGENNSIINCYSTGDVDGSGNGSGMFTGGLVGYNIGTIHYSYSNAIITGKYYAGGLVGYNLAGDISNCYSTGNVFRYEYVGGLIGYNEVGSISNCYSTGNVIGFGNNVGGLIGFGRANLVTNSFWDIETSGLNTSYGGIGKSTTEMMIQNTYTDSEWDFTDIWFIYENKSYPYLRWQKNIPPILNIPEDFVVLADFITNIGVVKNIKTTGSSYPFNLEYMGGKLYFGAYDDSHGFELWCSDGNESDTYLVKDINPGTAKGFACIGPGDILGIGNILYFRGDDGIHGRELWVSDGTEAGTYMIKDINPSGDSTIDDFTNVNGELFFLCDDGTNGLELWKSDGTETGTVIVKDINPTGDSLSYYGPSPFAVLDEMLYLIADDSIHGAELWTSDGTEAGTTIVKDINPGEETSYLNFLTKVNEELFFGAYDSTHGYELWRSDGNSEGTTLVKDILPGTGNSVPMNLMNVNDKLFFFINNDNTTLELWISDGTETGTVMVKNIKNTSGSSSIYLQTQIAVNDLLFFAYDDGINGIELWRSDGTEAGTFMVKDINPTASSNPRQMEDVNGILYFQADDGVHGVELWKSDGTEAGTVMVQDIIPGAEGSDPHYLTSENGMFYFVATDESGDDELWKYIPAGAVVYFIVEALDDSGSTPLVFTSHESRSIFPLGRTIVTCTAKDFLGNVGTGSFTITVKENTEEGLNIEVMPKLQRTLESPVTINFEEVTEKGNTGVILTETVPEEPVGYKNSPTFYDISTTATTSGMIEISIDYSDFIYETEENLKILHYEDTDADGVDDTWVDVTTYVDTINKIIYGEVSELSYFAVMEPRVYNVNKHKFYENIQTAVDDADSGDTIKIAAGIYLENIIIDRPLILLGEDSETTIIQGSGSGNGIYMNNLSNIEIRNFNIKDFNNGIYSEDCNGVVIEQNNISDNNKGIYISGPSTGIGITVNNNTIFDNTYGIYFIYSNNNLISTNVLTNNRFGIRIGGNCEFNDITFNDISSNWSQTGSHSWGILLSSNSNHNYVNNNIFSDLYYSIELSYFCIENEINNNVISTSGRNGINFSNNCNFNIISQNSFMESYQNCIYFDSSNNNTIADNTITTKGIYLRNNSYQNTITGNTFTWLENYSQPGGIYISDSDNCSIIGNTITDYFYSIDLSSSMNITISSNSIMNKGRYGIRLRYSDYGIINNNVISEGLYGIYLGSSSNSSISGNSMVNTGLEITGTSLEHWNSHQIDSTNLVNGDPVIYLKDTDGGTVLSGAGQVLLANCMNMTIEGQNLSNTCGGIQLGFSSNNTIRNNVSMYNNEYGLELEYSDNNSIYSNEFSNNDQEGINCYYSNDNIFSNNIITENSDRGLYIYRSEYTTIDNNTIINTYEGYGIYLETSKYSNVYENISNSNGGGLGSRSSSYSNIYDNNFNDIHYGIYAYYGGNNRITGNTVSNSVISGIYIYSMNNPIINSNIISNNNEEGITLSNVNDCTIDSNSILDNGLMGISLERSKNVIITNTTLINNGININGNNLDYWNTHTIDSSNTINGKPVIYWKDMSSGTIPANAGQIILANCQNVVVENQDISGCPAGIILGFSNYNMIKNNDFSNNTQNGISVYYSQNNTIYDNNLSNNSENGIYIIGSSYYGVSNYNKIIWNTILNNQDSGIYLLSSDYNNIEMNAISDNDINGIYLGSSDYNIVFGNNISSNQEYGLYFNYGYFNEIYQNNFINNTQQIRDYPTFHNIWDNGAGVGNYWSDYTGLDDGSDGRIAGDGIGDTDLPHQGVDNNPLIFPIGRVHNVNKDIYYTKIQVALNDANIGDSLEIGRGTYFENIVINKSVTLLGDDREKPIIQGLGSGIGIDISDQSYVNIQNLTIENFNIGINLSNSNDCSIIENVILANNEGIHLESSHNSNIEYNEVLNNYTGIYLNLSNHNWINFNNIIGNYYGIYLNYSKANKLRKNVLSDNVYGIVDPYSSDNIIEDNLITNNDVGIIIEDSQTNTIINNTIIENEIGLFVEDSDNNNISGNSVSENNIGIQIDVNSTDNSIYHNNIIENDTQATDTGTNIWDDGAGTGNFWSDYTGTDSDGDGIGDTAHVYDDNPIIEPPSNSPPVADIGGPYEVYEGTGIIFDASDSHDYNDNDTLQYRWDFNGDGTWDTNYSTEPTTAHTWYDEHTGTIALEVFDGELTDYEEITVTINNMAPIITSWDGPIIPVDLNVTIEMTGTFTDPGTLDTHTATIDWGDGTQTEGILIDSTVTGTHAYSAIGVYKVTVTITDNDSGTTSREFRYIAIYDSTEGHVTGGGWIDSPARAYTVDPTLTGKASFGFVAKYQKGKTIPSGNTEFQFKAGDLNFHSSEYQWLVVAGAKAQFKGTGTINGEGSYKFMITAIDGSLNGGGGSDKFRIKIWEEDDYGVESVIYDNGSDSEEGENLTEIGGGSIVIHTAKK